MNTGNFAGYLGRDAEVKAGPSGDTVANFSIAVNTGTKEKPSTLWVDCTLWGKRADALAQYLTKGTFVVVAGKVDCRCWIGKDGHAASTITCRVESLTFGGKSGNGNGASSKSGPASAPAQTAPRNTVGALHETMAAQDKASGNNGSNPTDFSDDIPF